MRVGRPSLLWTVAAVVAALLAAIAATVAVATQRASDRPIGEGTLFRSEADAAAEMLEALGSGHQDDEIVRRIRNALDIESVALVDPSGKIQASTSPGSTGQTLESGFLLFLLSEGRFGAVAAPTRTPVLVDGVEEWPVGSVLYTVVEPVEGGALVLQYDVSELLVRRAQRAGIRAETIELAVAALFFGLVAVGASIGRFRVAARNEVLRREAELLRRHSTELEIANVELDAARRSAEEALELAEEKNRVRAEFVLMINHELRTPLTGVVTGAELLQSGAVTDEADRVRLLADMVADGNRLQEMIGHMLAVARIENRGLNFDLQEVSVRALCQQIETQHPRLEATVSPVEGSLVTADPTTLPQVIGSLVDNAYQHGATSVRLECADHLPFEPMLATGTPPSSAVHFVVIDDGPGIDQEFLPRAFQKFEKDSRSSGTGLGLYLASMMVGAMKGSMSLTTSLRGTSIAVSLPARPAESLEKAG